MSRFRCALLLAAACALAGGARSSGAVPPSPAWVVLSTDELAAQYDTLWAISDVHGRLEPLRRLLAGAGLTVRAPDGGVRWNPSARRQLLLMVGDCIDGGEDSVGVTLLFEELQRQAAATGSRVVVLLGNHEASFLAKPEANASPELMASVARAGLGPAGGMTALQLYDSEFGRYLRTLPVGAFIGTWLFAHAGYIDAEPEPAALRAWFAELDREYTAGGRRPYRSLAKRTSILAYHRWWKDGRRAAGMRTSLRLLGMNGVVIGHDPDTLGVRRKIAINGEGWLMKLDTGMKSGSAGRLLRCAVADIVREGSLVMVIDGRPTCSAVSASAVEDLAVR